MRSPASRQFWAAIVVVLLGGAGCRASPPALTGVTIFPSDANGAPVGTTLSRTALRPPVPVIGVRPGTDPTTGRLFLNEPTSGAIAITLARGTQNFLLYTVSTRPAPHFVVALFLEHEPTPALTTVVDGSGLSNPVVVSGAPTVMNLSGDAVANHSSLSVIRNGYRVSLQHAAFPLPNLRVDAIMPWHLQPDNVADAIGLITINVREAGSGHGA